MKHVCSEDGRCTTQIIFIYYDKRLFKMSCEEWFGTYMTELLDPGHTRYIVTVTDNHLSKSLLKENLK